MPSARGPACRGGGGQAAIQHARAVAPPPPSREARRAAERRLPTKTPSQAGGHQRARRGGRQRAWRLLTRKGFLESVRPTGTAESRSGSSFIADARPRRTSVRLTAVCCAGQGSAGAPGHASRTRIPSARHTQKPGTARAEHLAGRLTARSSGRSSLPIHARSLACERRQVWSQADSVAGRKLGPGRACH